MSALALIHMYVSIDPHIDDAVVGVNDGIPHLVDASFVPFTHLGRIPKPSFQRVRNTIE
jgi:hypothetical protein